MRNHRRACGVIAGAADRNFEATVRAISLICAMTLAWACGSDKQQPQSSGPPLNEAPANTEEPGLNQPPKVDRLELQPKPLRPGQVARAQVEASDPNGGSPRVLFEWSVNGRRVEDQTGSTFQTDGLRRGDVLEVIAKAFDGSLTSEPATARITLGNTPPEVRSVVAGPAGIVRPNEVVEAIVDAEDADGDAIKLTYRWFVNGNERGTKRKFSTNGLRRNDRIEVEVTPSDGRVSGKARRSETLTLVNSPPQFVTRGVPQPKQAGDLFTYEFEAKDPDGDRRLRWELVEGPDGMVMDPVLGTLHWRPGGAEVGRHPVEIRVTDPHGESTAMRFHLEVSEEYEEEPTPASPSDAR